MRRSVIVRLALGLAALTPAACDNGPVVPEESDGVDVRVEFSLKVKTSAGLDLCQQTDLATLTIRQGSRVRTQTVRPQGDPDCVAEFDVTVQKGMVEFAGELLGNGRPLMRGFGELEALADGFRLSIPLDEIPALTVVTRTEGSAGPEAFQFAVDDGDLLSIGRNSVQTVGAIAAGMRRVSLIVSGCIFVPSQQVELPPDPSTVRLLEFDIVCKTAVTPNGTLAVVTTTSGEPPMPTAYQVRIGGGLPLPLAANDTLTREVVKGDHVVEFGGHESFTNCRLREPSRTTVTVDSAKTSIVRFTVDCEKEEEPPKQPADTTGGIRIVTRTFGPATPPVKYAVTITAANTNPLTVFLPPNDSTEVSPLLTANNPYTVFLATTKSCEVRGSPSVAVDVPGGGLARVVFTIDCPPKSPSRLPRVPALDPPGEGPGPARPAAIDAATRSVAPSRVGAR